MKRRLAAGVAVAILMGAALTPSASASIQRTAPKNILLDGNKVASPSGFAANGTTYMPVWYVMHALNSLGIQSHWDGSHWNMVMPASDAPDFTGLNIGSGNISIRVNGNLVKKVNGIAAVDPSSRSLTMYMPVWYVMEILRHVHVSSTWDGTNWRLEDLNPLVNALKSGDSATNFEVVSDLNMQMHMNLTSVGQQNLAGSNTPLDDQIKIHQDIRAGTVNGQRAASIAMTVADAQNTATPAQTINEYIQGTSAYVNDGTGAGWKTIPLSSVKSVGGSVQPDLGLQLSMIQNPTAQSTSTGYLYSGALNAAGLQGYLETALANTSTNGGFTSAQIAQLLSAVKGTVQIAVTDTQNGPQITGETGNMDMTLPSSALVNPSNLQPGDSSFLQDVSSVTIHETIDSIKNYLPQMISPPSGVSASTSSTAGDSTGSGVPGSSSGSSGTGPGSTSGSTPSTSSTSTGANPLHMSWTGYEGNVGSNMTLAGNLVVAADADSNGSIYAYNALTGQQAWEFPQNTFYNGILAGSPNVVLMTLENNGIQALSTADGQPVWSKQIPTPVDMKIVGQNAYVITGNTLYVYNAKTGQQLWTHVFSDTLTHVNADSQQVIVGASDGKVYVLNLDGTPVYAAGLSSSKVTGLTPFNGNWLITEGSQVFAVGPSGTLLWKYDAGSSMAGGNVAVDEGSNTAFVLNGRPQAVALDLTTGTVKYSQNLAFAAFSAPVAANGVVYYASNLGYLVGLSESDLSPQSITASYSPTEKVYTAVPPLVYQGTVIVQSHQPGYSGDATLIGFD
ncbi:PQQ-like beta-propeller repeat protein [Alicyclobacillus tolerans]|uniref:outer membrane protein assembly factor BamB family protein n=1 Tax=Alicyclobacillus tolerans TaxID=90970 RepID=UPI001F370A5D|nr:PQQ-binding-like beta-propeller repeat protein [Alicyclobacillus tolerans]MCF8568040.1 PQQ-like beta-propeller repeat protein [Alicyclobacillus tolerans]